MSHWILTSSAVCEIFLSFNFMFNSTWKQWRIYTFWRFRSIVILSYFLYTFLLHGYKTKLSIPHVWFILSYCLLTNFQFYNFLITIENGLFFSATKIWIRHCFAALQLFVSWIMNQRETDFSDGNLGKARVRQWWEKRGIDYRFSTLLWIVWARTFHTTLSSVFPSHVSRSRVIYLACAELTRQGTDRMAAIDRQFSLSWSRSPCFSVFERLFLSNKNRYFFITAEWRCCFVT